MAKRDYYSVDGDDLKRLRRECPKCGQGVFLAVHKDRVSCGACGYTEFKKKPEPKKKGKALGDAPPAPDEKAPSLMGD